MPSKQETLPRWFPYVDLGCVGLASALWYAMPAIGPWPLFLALFPWGLRFIYTGKASKRTSFDLPLIIFLLIAGLGVWSAFNREAAWSKFWLIAGGLLLYYAFVNAEPLDGIRVWILAVFGAGVALYFIVTHDWGAYPGKITALSGLGRALQAPLPPVPGHRLHPNVAGGIMAMFVPFAGLAAIWSTRLARTRPGGLANWLRLAAAVALLLWSCFGLLMTTSRGAWLGLAVAGFLAILWAAAGYIDRHTRLSHVWAFLGMAALMLVAALLAVLAWPAGTESLLTLIPGPDTATPRLELLSNTLTLVGDYPLLGAGLGSFMMLYSTYAMLMHVGFTVHSHNLFLNVAVELGAVALFVLVWMWLLFGGTLLRAARRAEEEPELQTGRESLGAAVLSLVVLLVHGLADDVLFGSRGVILLFVPLSFAVPFARRGWVQRRRWVAVGLPLALITVLIASLLSRDALLSRIFSNLGAVSQSRAELSTYDWPDWPIQDALRSELDLSTPVTLYQRALDLDASNSTANRRMGQILLSRGYYQDALLYLEAAHEVEPGNTTTRQLLGEAYAANGRFEDGRALWSGLSDSQGQLRLRSWWYTHIGMEEVADWMARMAAEQ